MHPCLRSWEGRWDAKSIRNLAYHAQRTGKYDVWLDSVSTLGGIKPLLFNYYWFEAAIEDYMRTHGEWGDELLRLPMEIKGEDDGQ